jgi:hypothetical protein
LAVAYAITIGIGVLEVCTEEDLFPIFKPIVIIIFLE